MWAVLRRSSRPPVVASLPRGSLAAAAARSTARVGGPPSAPQQRLHLLHRGVGPARRFPSRAHRISPPSGLGLQCFHASAARAADYYAALGLSKAASPSDKDIKIAYFKVARSCHPDAVRALGAKEQAAAKKRFQEAANAYEVLSNPLKKADYDRQAASSDSGGFWGQSSSTGGTGQQQQQQQQANANQTWSTVSNDADVIEEAIHEYAAELKENAELAAAGVAKGDFSPAWAFLKHHKGLVATVVLPTLLVFRFPGPVMVAMRFVPQALLALLAFSVRIGGTSGLMTLWRLVGSAAAFGSSNAAGAAKSYVADRKKTREEARAQAQKNAEQRARSGDSTDARSGHAKSSSADSKDDPKFWKAGAGRRTRHTKK